jgi:hypothetical protein
MKIDTEKMKALSKELQDDLKSVILDMIEATPDEYVEQAQPAITYTLAKMLVWSIFPLAPRPDQRVVNNLTSQIIEKLHNLVYLERN